jgi:hypothetical protein
MIFYVCIKSQGKYIFPWKACATKSCVILTYFLAKTINEGKLAWNKLLNIESWLLKLEGEKLTPLKHGLHQLLPMLICSHGSLPPSTLESNAQSVCILCSAILLCFFVLFIVWTHLFTGYFFVFLLILTLAYVWQGYRRGTAAETQVFDYCDNPCISLNLYISLAIFIDCFHQ